MTPVDGRQDAEQRERGAAERGQANGVREGQLGQLRTVQGDQDVLVASLHSSPCGCHQAILFCRREAANAYSARPNAASAIT